MANVSPDIRTDTHQTHEEMHTLEGGIWGIEASGTGRFKLLSYGIRNPMRYHTGHNTGRVSPISNGNYGSDEQATLQFTGNVVDKYVVPRTPDVGPYKPSWFAGGADELLSFLQDWVEPKTWVAYTTVPITRVRLDRTAATEFMGNVVDKYVVPKMPDMGSYKPSWFAGGADELLSFPQTQPDVPSAMYVQWSTLSPHPVSGTTVGLQSAAATSPSLVEFAKGLDGVEPKSWVVDMAARLTQAVLDTVDPEVTVDVDGALSFDLRLADGQLVLAELELNGTLDASVYDQHGVLTTRLPQATESDLLALFKR